MNTCNSQNYVNFESCKMLKNSIFVIELLAGERLTRTNLYQAHGNILSKLDPNKLKDQVQNYFLSLPPITGLHFASRLPLIMGVALGVVQE